MSTINDQLDNVRFLLGNRTNLDSRINAWLGTAYLELGMSVDFTELEQTEEPGFLQGVTEYDYPTNARAIKALTGFVNDTPYPLKLRDIRIVERYQVTTNSQGIPAIWAPYGNQYIVRPSPNSSYASRVRFWQKPVLSTPVEDTELLLPDDWLVVLDYIAAILGNIALGQADKAKELNMLIHGDPKHPENPGLIKQKLKNRNAAQNVASDYATDPNIRSYTSR